MQNMFCYECVLKHLAGALSYGKQVISGHGKGDALDHRIDFLGQIKNASDHLQFIDKILFDQLNEYRKNIQSKKIFLTLQDLQFIRKFYLQVEMAQEGNNPLEIQYEKTIITDNVDIVYNIVTNKEWFDLSYTSIKNNLFNYNKIYVLNSLVELTQYEDVIVLNVDLKQLCSKQYITDNFVLMYENNAIIQQTNARQIILTFSMKTNDIKDTIRYFINKGYKRQIYNYDRLKPQIINKTVFNNNINDYNGNDYVTAYYYLTNKSNFDNDIYHTVFIDRNICCSTPQALRTKKFVRWNQNGFKYIKEYLQQNN